MATRRSINYDVLADIVEKLQSDYSTLYSCSLVNHAFNLAASRLLYREITLCPEYTAELNLGQREQELNGAFISAQLQHNRHYVLRLHIGGYLSPRPPPRNNLDRVLEIALRCWPSVQTIKFTPLQFPRGLFIRIVPLLKPCAFLRDLTINASCCDDACSPFLADITGLEALTIKNPTRAILQLLPQWLELLSTTLKKFQLKGDCGSLTPGVLRSFNPHLSEIRTLSLGISYSLTNDDVFLFLSQLTSVSSLELRYYMQMRPVTVQPHLTSLRHFTVRYLPTPMRSQFEYLRAWVRYVTEHSPLETLQLCSEFPNARLPNVSFDGLINHLGVKHKRTLRILKMQDAYIGTAAFENICVRCTKLEEIAVGIPVGVLDNLPACIMPCHALHTLSLSTPNVRRSRGSLFDTVQATELLERTRPCKLRRLCINAVQWEASWTASAEGRVEYVVHTAVKPRAPWQRTPGEGSR